MYPSTEKKKNIFVQRKKIYKFETRKFEFAVIFLANAN